MTLQHIREVVEKCSGYDNLREKTRKEERVDCRFVFYKIATETGHSAKSCANFLGYSHSTALRALELHEDNLNSNFFYSTLYTKCYDKIYSKNNIDFEEFCNYLYNKYHKKFSDLIPDSMVAKLESLSPSQLEDFEKTRLDPYLKMNL